MHGLADGAVRAGEHERPTGVQRPGRTADHVREAVALERHSRREAENVALADHGTPLPPSMFPPLHTLANDFKLGRQHTRMCDDFVPEL